MQQYIIHYSVTASAVKIIGDDLKPNVWCHQDHCKDEGSYYIIPVDSEDQLLLDVKWQGEVYFNTRLYLSLRCMTVSTIPG